MKISHTYTVRELRQKLHHDGKAVQPAATLSLDNQPGAPVLGWGSLPHKIDLFGDTVADLALGQTVRLSLVAESGDA